MHLSDIYMSFSGMCFFRVCAIVFGYCKFFLGYLQILFGYFKPKGCFGYLETFLGYFKFFFRVSANSFWVFLVRKAVSDILKPFSRIVSSIFRYPQVFSDIVTPKGRFGYLETFFAYY